MEETHEVFLYGAGLDPERMRSRCPSATSRRAARLVDWALAFNKVAVERDGTGQPNVEPRPGAAVEGAVYTMTRTDLHRLDASEGHPGQYSRRLLAVTASDGARVAAWVYVATPEWKGEGLVAAARDVAHMLAGADVLSGDYADRIRSLVP